MSLYRPSSDKNLSGFFYHYYYFQINVVIREGTCCLKTILFNLAINVLKKTYIHFKAMIKNLTSLFLIPVVLVCICKKECSSDNLSKLTKYNNIIIGKWSNKYIYHFCLKKSNKTTKPVKMVTIASEYLSHQSKSGLYFKRQILSQLWQL